MAESPKTAHEPLRLMATAGGLFHSVAKWPIDPSDVTAATMCPRNGQRRGALKPLMPGLGCRWRKRYRGPFLR